MLIHIYGLTEMTLSLNSIGSTLRGKSRLNSVQVSNEQLRSLEPLAQRGWIELVSAEPEPPQKVDAPKMETSEPLQPSVKSTPDLPSKPTKHIEHTAPVNDLVSGNDIEKQEATVVDSTGQVSKRKLSNNASVKQAPESKDSNRSVQASLSTQAKLEKDAAEDAASEDEDMDESLLDESERSGQEVVIASGSGKSTKVKMGKKASKIEMIPSGDESQKPSDSPFIPPEEYGQKTPTATDIMVDNDGNPVSIDDDDKTNDAFIE